MQVDPPFTLGGILMGTISRERISQKMRQEFFNARNQISRDGIKFMTPLSSNLNALFRSYFKDEILPYIPPPQGGSVVLTYLPRLLLRPLMITFMV